MAKSTTIRKGDRVKVITGKDKGKESRVLRVYPHKERLVVERVNMVKKHQRPTNKQPQGGILEIEGSHPCLERDAGVPELLGADARRSPSRGRRSHPRVQEVWKRHRLVGSPPPRRRSSRVRNPAAREEHGGRTGGTQVQREVQGRGRPEADELTSSTTTCTRCRDSRRSSSTWAWVRRPSTRSSSTARSTIWRSSPVRSPR